MILPIMILPVASAAEGELVMIRHAEGESSRFGFSYPISKSPDLWFREGHGFSRAV